MENRLVYLAVAAEKQEDAEAARAEKAPDELEQTGADLARLESLKAEPGGTGVSRQAKAMIEGGKISDVAEDLLKKQIGTVEAAVATRKNNLTPETTKLLNTANDKLKATVEKQKKRAAENAVSDSKFGRMAGLGRADEIFKDVKISVNGKTFEWKKGQMENFRLLPLEGKKDFVKKMAEALLASPDGVDQVLEKFGSDSRLPKKWTDKPDGYCWNPEKHGHTKKHAAEWLTQNADKKILQAETAFKFLEGNNHLLEKAGVGMPLKSEIFDKSTTEFNQYFEGMKQKIASVDKDMASRMDAMKMSEGTEIKTIDTQNTEAMQKEAAETTQQAKDITPKIVELVKTMKIDKRSSELAAELEKKSKTGASVESDNVASLRERAQNEESVSAWEKMKSFFGTEKAAADGYSDQVGEKKDFDPEAEARKQVVAETLGDKKSQADFEKALGVSGLEKEDLAKASGLLTIQELDSKAIEDKLNSDQELKKLLARKAADDYPETRMAA